VQVGVMVGAVSQPSRQAGRQQECAGGSNGNPQAGSAGRKENCTRLRYLPESLHVIV